MCSKQPSSTSHLDECFCQKLHEVIRKEEWSLEPFFFSVKGHSTFCAINIRGRHAIWISSSLSSPFEHVASSRDLDLAIGCLQRRGYSRWVWRDHYWSNCSHGPLLTLRIWASKPAFDAHVQRLLSVLKTWEMGFLKSQLIYWRGKELKTFKFLAL